MSELGEWVSAITGALGLPDPIVHGSSDSGHGSHGSGHGSSDDHSSSSDDDWGSEED